MVFRQSGRWFFMFYTEIQRTIRYMLLKSMTPAICPLRAMPICIKLHIKRGGIPSCAENVLNWCPFLSTQVLLRGVSEHITLSFEYKNDEAVYLPRTTGHHSSRANWQRYDEGHGCGSRQSQHAYRLFETIS